MTRFQQAPEPGFEPTREKQFLHMHAVLTSGLTPTQEPS